MCHLKSHPNIAVQLLEHQDISAWSTQMVYNALSMRTYCTLWSTIKNTNILDEIHYSIVSAVITGTFWESVFIFRRTLVPLNAGVVSATPLLYDPVPVVDDFLGDFNYAAQSAEGTRQVAN